MPAAELLHGEKAYRDIIPAHGFVQDALVDYVAFRTGPVTLGRALKFRGVISATIVIAHYALVAAATGSPEIGLASTFLAMLLGTAGGSIRLPLVGSLSLQGQTLDEATDTIRMSYEEKGYLKKDRERVSCTLIRSRVHRVVILRDDAQSISPTFVAKSAVPFSKIGRGEVIDLPAYENDILHALAATGGLPGIAGYAEGAGCGFDRAFARAALFRASCLD